MTIRYPYAPVFTNAPQVTASGLIQAVCTSPGLGSTSFSITDMANSQLLTTGNTSGGTVLNFAGSGNESCSSSGGFGLVEGCFINGSSSVTTGDGIGYEVTGTIGQVQVEIDSSRALSAAVSGNGSPGSSVGTATADFFTRTPFRLEVPFIAPVSVVNSIGTVAPSSAMISRSDGAASGTTTLEWRVYRDNNLDSMVDAGDTQIGSAGSISVSESGVVTNGTASTYTLPRDFYVLEVTYTTTGQLTASADCTGMDSAAANVLDDVELLFDITP